MVGYGAVLIIPIPAYSLTSKVIITSGGSSPQLRDRIGSNLTRIVNSLTMKNWNDIEPLCDGPAEGLKSLRDLVDSTSCKNVYPIYESKLVTLVGDTAIVNGPAYEVRNIKLKVNTKGMNADPYKNTVFVFSKAGLLMEVRFAIEQHHYDEMMRQAKLLGDFKYRERIIQFLEIFRTAYNRYDLEYLERVYSDDALIIVGRVLTVDRKMKDMLTSGTMPQQEIQYIKQDKRQYIERLRGIFKASTYLHVQFEEIRIRRHKEIPEVYGITLRQDWRTPTYHDEGYLFLLIDFRKLDQPLIRVRTWQPEKYRDGTPLEEKDIITMDQFPIH